MKLLFGTAGCPRSSKSSDTLSGLERIKQLGLDFMELEFVQGIYINEALARQVRAKKAELGLHLTVHAPYFINLNAHEPEKITSSQKRIYDSTRIGAMCGADSVTFHAGFYLGDPPEKTYQAIKKNLKEILTQLKKDMIDVRLSPELTGKALQFGSLDELIRLSSELKGITPCIDFSHMHARTGGKYNTYKEFVGILKQIKKSLGKEALAGLHIHAAGIEYSFKGEREHLNLAESDFNYKDLLKALKDYDVGGWLVCESPNLETDAILMRDYYNKLSIGC